MPDDGVWLAFGEQLGPPAIGHFAVFLVVHVDGLASGLLCFDLAQLGADFVGDAS